MRRQDGNAVVGVIVTAALVAFVALWMWLAKTGKAPNVGLGIKLGLPTLLGGLVVLILILAGLFARTAKRPN